MLQAAEVAGFEGRQRRCLVRFAFPVPEAQMRMASGQRALEHGRGEGFFLHLRQQPEVARSFARGPGLETPAVEAYLTGRRRAQAGERVQRQRLAGAVAPEHGHELPRPHLEIEVRHEGLPGLAGSGDGELMRAEHSGPPYGCSRETRQAPPVNAGSPSTLQGASARCQRARSCRRKAASTQSSASSTHSR